MIGVLSVCSVLGVGSVHLRAHPLTGWPDTIDDWSPGEVHAYFIVSSV